MHRNEMLLLLHYYGFPIDANEFMHANCQPFDYSELQHSDATSMYRRWSWVEADAFRTGRLLGWSCSEQWRWVVFRLLMRCRYRPTEAPDTLRSAHRHTPVLLPVPISAISSRNAAVVADWFISGDCQARRRQRLHRLKCTCAGQDFSQDKACCCPDQLIVTVWSSSSCMRVMNHNWSATKQRLHPQSVAEISRHSVLSGDRIRQCETSSGSRHKDTDQCL